MGTREIIEKIVKERETDGGIKSVVWIAAGGSNGGNYPAQYFMDREAKGIRSQMFTSNEFVYAPPKFVGTGYDRGCDIHERNPGNVCGGKGGKRSGSCNHCLVCSGICTDRDM